VPRWRTRSAPRRPLAETARPRRSRSRAGGGLVAAFAACGSAITGTAAPGAQKFLADDSDNTGAGNSAGATSAATGSEVTVGWSSLDDWWGAVTIQVNN
jgi:hypothetical protein